MQRSAQVSFKDGKTCNGYHHPVKARANNLAVVSHLRPDMSGSHLPAPKLHSKIFKWQKCIKGDWKKNLNVFGRMCRRDGGLKTLIFSMGLARRGISNADVGQHGRYYESSTTNMLNTCTLSGHTSTWVYLLLVWYP